MNERSRVLFLIAIMMLVALVVGSISIALLYRTAFREQETRLIEIAQSQARLIEAMARFDARHSGDYPGGSEAATLSQMNDAHEYYAGLGKTGEFTLAKREGDLIVFVLSHRHSDLDHPQPVPFGSDLAKPMQRALSGESGTVVGKDYRGETVLAAFEPVAELNMGIVAKIDLSEVQEPFIKAGIIAGLVGMAVVLLGAVLFFRLTNPLLRSLAESEEQFRSTFEQAAVGIAHATPEGRFIKINQRFCDIVGYSRDEMLALTFQEITHPDDLDTDLGYVQQVLAGEFQNYALEKRYIRQDGSRVWVNLTVSLVRKASGEPRYLLSIIEDISQRKQAQETLQESENRYRFLLESIVDSVYVLDHKWRHVVVNDAAEHFVQVPKETLLKGKLTDLFPGIEETAFFETFQRVMETRQPDTVVNEYTFEDGRRDWYEVRVYPVPEGILCISRDISPRKRAEAALQEHSERLEDMVDERTHELRAAQEQ